jgi:trans-aconitate 2-methyltransferase
MNFWDSRQYLKFAEERTRPCRDLAVRVMVSDVRRVIDLGCGPGNSTQVLGSSWPAATITGVDDSPEMIAAAQRTCPEFHFIRRDISSWITDSRDTFEVVFSNAALHWVPHHDKLFPSLFKRVSRGGALAVQMPADINAPAHQIMRELAGSAAWQRRFSSPVREWHCHDIGFYYDLLSADAAKLDLWETEYIHILPNAEAIVEWYKGTGLRPFLDALPTDEHKQAFTTEYLERIRPAYRLRPDGVLLFKFRRMFIITYRS